MTGPTPRRPTGNNAEAQFAQAVWDRLWGAQRVMSVPGAIVNRTTRGVAVIPKARAGGGGVGEMRQAKITTLNADDYISVKFWDGSGYVGDEFNVARSWASRMVASDTIDGTTYDYSYADDNNRTSDDGVTEESQVLYPRFVVGKVISVGPIDYSGVDDGDGDLKWIEVNTAREWVKKYEAA